MTAVDSYGNALRVVRHEMPSHHEQGRPGGPIAERREYACHGGGAFVTLVPVRRGHALALAVDCRAFDVAGDVLAWTVSTPAAFWQALADMHAHIEASGVERVCVVIDEGLPALPASAYLLLCPADKCA